MSFRHLLFSSGTRLKIRHARTGGKQALLLYSELYYLTRIAKLIHNQMPVILKQEDEKIWLSSKNSAEILSLLKPYPPEEMDAYPVSKLVNSSRNDVPLVWVKEER